MVRIISGPKGSGKTKKIIDFANEKIKETTGEIVFINDREKYREKINKSIRYVSTNDFYIYTPAVLFGFLNGLIAGNYDIDTIFVDNLVRIAKIEELDDLEELFKGIDLLSEKYDVTFIVSVTSDEPLPEEYRAYAFS
ncbi:thymidine kinase [Alkalibaculum bacchi]|uniref:Thymidine kinase n=1 Tax=Alkalibaculum bacchi TaxID=645887 RepID=A0A366IFD6_9FIRM|nr:hypothetical protein [Alkalibaculum bacchi]RBP70056.1 thymidine kinase [Alkalibaculum bacchi]